MTRPVRTAIRETAELIAVFSFVLIYYVVIMALSGISYDEVKRMPFLSQVGVGFILSLLGLAIDWAINLPEDEDKGAKRPR